MNFKIRFNRELNVTNGNVAITSCVLGDKTKIFVATQEQTFLVDINTF